LGECAKNETYAFFQGKESTGKKRSSYVGVTDSYPLSIEGNSEERELELQTSGYRLTTEGVPPRKHRI